MSDVMNNDESKEREAADVPKWAAEMGLDEPTFRLVMREAFRSGVPPIVVARGWIKEMAERMVAQAV